MLGTAIGIIGTALAVISLWLAWRWNRQSKQEINKIRDETVAARVVLNNRLDQGVAVKLGDPRASRPALTSSAKKALSQDRTCAGSGSLSAMVTNPLWCMTGTRWRRLYKSGSRRTTMKEAEDRLGLTAELSRLGRDAAPRPPTSRRQDGGVLVHRVRRGRLGGDLVHLRPQSL